MACGGQPMAGGGGRSAAEGAPVAHGHRAAPGDAGRRWAALGGARPMGATVGGAARWVPVGRSLLGARRVLCRSLRGEPSRRPPAADVAWPAR